MKSLLDFLGCPLRHYPANRVPESEIRCRYVDCINGQGVGGAGVCRDGDPRSPDCASFKETCGECGGDGGWDGKEATCKVCSGMGYL